MSYKQTKKRLTPYQRIVRNAEKGLGVVLSAEEVFGLTLDDAITTRADLDDANDEGTPDKEYVHGFGGK